MNITKRSIITTVDGDATVKDALKILSRRIEQPARRAFLQRTLTLGGVAMLSGCNLTDGNSVDMDLERARFAENSVKYEATLRFINANVKTTLDAMKSYHQA